MALDYNQVTATTEKYFLGKLADNIFDSNPLMKRAQSRFLEVIDGGERIMMPLGYATTTSSGWFNGYDTLSTSDNDQITAAALTWKQIYANITISGREERQNSGKAAVVRLLQQKVKMAEKTIKDSMGTGLYNAGSTTNAIIGLRAWCNTSSTVGGMSQSTYSWWAGNLDSTTTTLSLYAMQTQFNEAAVDSELPTVCMTTRSIYNYYYALLQPQQRFVDAETAKAGFSSLMFNGIPVIADSHCPSSHLFMLNEKALHLFAHKDCNFKLEPFTKPTNQDAQTAKILWMGAFGSDNNRLHAMFTGVTA